MKFRFGALHSEASRPYSLSNYSASQALHVLPSGGTLVLESTTAPTQNTSTELTVIVPTRNEAGNVAPLVARLDAALGDSDAEILFVDDSSDETPQQIAKVRVRRRRGQPVPRLEEGRWPVLACSADGVERDDETRQGVLSSQAQWL